MSALDTYISIQVNGGNLDEFLDIYGGFPKNESSWEELFDFGEKRIAEIVSLMKNAAQQSVQLTALRRGLAVSIFFNVILLTVVLFTIGGN